MHNVTIYHNPKCGTSRNVLALIRATGIEPTIIEYLNNPPTVTLWIWFVWANPHRAKRIFGSPRVSIRVRAWPSGLSKGFWMLCWMCSMA